MEHLTRSLGPDVSVVGMPIPGFAGIDAITTEQDWVVTGSNCGKPFKMYCSPHVTMQEAIVAVARAMNANANTLDWITAQRREQVERCVRMEGDWLRSRTI